MVAAAILTLPSSMLQLSHAQANSDFINTILSIHNRERALVNVPPLTWSNNLAAAAQTWANHLLTLGLKYGDLAVHDDSIIDQGENLVGPGIAGVYTTAQNVQLWVNEKSNYHGGPYNEQPGGPVIGHYIQMVWRNTKEIGCAASSDGTLDFLVCRYSPPGSYPGENPY